MGKWTCPWDNTMSCHLLTASPPLWVLTPFLVYVTSMYLPYTFCHCKMICEVCLEQFSFVTEKAENSKKSPGLCPTLLPRRKQRLEKITARETEKKKKVTTIKFPQSRNSNGKLWGNFSFSSVILWEISVPKIHAILTMTSTEKPRMQNIIAYNARMAREHT